jgi:FMN-dependent NADH-azoreductase
MKQLLIINSSPRSGRSHSRRLTEVFVNHWQNKHADASVTYRELGLEHVPHVSETWIAGVYKPAELRTAEEKAALAKSDEYIKELREANVIVIGVPMYNYSFPSSLKAYIDQILRINETWELNHNNLKDPYIGLLKDKKMYLLLSRGAQGYEAGGYNEHVNFQTTYLKAAFKMAGIVDIHEVAINGELFGDKTLKDAIESAHLKIKEIIENEKSH